MYPPSSWISISITFRCRYHFATPQIPCRGSTTGTAYGAAAVVVALTPAGGHRSHFGPVAARSSPRLLSKTRPTPYRLGPAAAPTRAGAASRVRRPPSPRRLSERGFWWSMSALRLQDQRQTSYQLTIRRRSLPRAPRLSRIQPLPFIQWQRVISTNTGAYPLTN